MRTDVLNRACIWELRIAIPTEHKTVQARFLGYLQDVGWTRVQRAEAEARRGFDQIRRYHGETPEMVVPPAR